MHKLLKAGNAKVNKNTLLFNLPTIMCGLNCPKCYARKAEIRFPKALAYRLTNYDISNTDYFKLLVNDELRKSKKYICRIHESGDFYSQNYISKWTNIALENPDIKFYCYTKKKNTFDFFELESLPNVNVIDSLTPLGYNYGDQAHCNSLVRNYGYYLCPCKKGVKVDCMLDCQVCLTNNKVCFLEH